MESFPCAFCPKEFALEAARDLHHVKHETYRKEFVCHVCLTPLSDLQSLNQHEARHLQGPSCLCLTCGEEFRRPDELRRHEWLHPEYHSSKRQHILFQSADEVNAAFHTPTPLNGNSLQHITDRRSAQEIQTRHAMRTQMAFRPHDGATRRDDAPKTCFFSASDILHTTSPHPVLAEPGELCSALLLPLDTFVRTPGEYRMYFVALTSLNHFESGAMRCTVLLASSEYWEWCDERGLVELDVRTNSVLSCSEDDCGKKQWSVAAHVFVPGKGARSVAVAVAIAGESIDIAGSGFGFVDTARLFQVNNLAYCPTCLTGFSHRMKLFEHLAVFHGHGSISVFEDRPFACRTALECDKSFATNEERSQHELRHFDSIVLPCRHECNRFFHTKRERNSHEQTHRLIEI